MKNQSQARRKSRTSGNSPQAVSKSTASTKDKPTPGRRTKRRKSRTAPMVALEFHPGEYRIVCQRECVCPTELIKVSSPEMAAVYWNLYIRTHPMHNPDVECLVGQLLNTRNCVIGHYFISVGTLNSLHAHPREIYRAAVIGAAASIIHNHPSGDPEPSLSDHRVTRQVYQAGLILKIELMDHVIIGARRGGYASKSLRELGCFHQYEIGLKAGRC